MNRAVICLLASVALVSCGGGGSSSGGGARAFDVQATLTLHVTTGGSWTDFPRTHAFTLVWNGDEHLVLIGAVGFVDAANETKDGGTHRTATPTQLPVPFAPSCNGRGAVTYDEITFTIEGGTLQGTASGSARYQVGDQIFMVGVQATLTGTADATPPSFAALRSEVDPLAPPAFFPSEPLPPTATATLVGATSGDVVPLATGDPLDAGHGQVVTDFVVPLIGLRPAETYTLTTDGIVDFAGHAVTQTPAPGFTTRAAPPLVPEDGFESVATPTLGGAGVLRGEPLMPLAGTTSLILNTGVGGGFGFLPYMLGPSLAVRLAVAPGDTVVRFERRLVATYDVPSVRFFGAIRLGSVGGTVGLGPTLEANDLVKVTLPRDGDIYVSGVQTIEVPLPPGATGEITFEIDGQTTGCGGLPPTPTALVIDGLRVE